ncbi:Transmembrane protein 26 [Merluccius polli]|uniref:Transmembrane protein 26 n=1 Tax=Merluccius polli TaxID=89951 RepID=A0AA47NBZ3_MERPO|nr:Transmembrane protein 26 [Merluccius polli]
MLDFPFKAYMNLVHRIGVSVCPKSWILALHMILLILLILGKWLLPIGGGVTRDELSQLLLIFVGTAADILEFTNETPLVQENDSFELIYLILAVWTWSMLQFPFHLAVANTKSEEDDQDASVLSKHSTDLLTVVQALFIHDGPFLVVRLIVLIYFREFNQMLVFFAVKNSLMIMLSLYRLIVICLDTRSAMASDRNGQATRNEVVKMYMVVGWVDDPVGEDSQLNTQLKHYFLFSVSN